MKQGQGTIVQYEQKDGTIQKALMRPGDQKKEFSDYRKVFLRLLNDDLTVKETNGKRVIALIDAQRLKQIGFLD